VEDLRSFTTSWITREAAVALIDASLEACEVALQLGFDVA
jgi:hypothetical protein